MHSADAPGEQFPLWHRIQMGDGLCSLITGFFVLCFSFFFSMFALDVSQQTNMSPCLPHDTCYLSLWAIPF